jgi:tRNA (guanine37-N1)-methyltransferase
VRVDVLTTFPEMLAPVLNASILKRAQEAGIVTIAVHDLRRWTTDRHHTTDDYPYGGGAGMVMKPDPFFAAVDHLLGRSLFTPSAFEGPPAAEASPVGQEPGSAGFSLQPQQEPGSAGFSLQPQQEPGSAGFSLQPQRGEEVILLTPQGQPFTQALARQLSAKQHLILLCGRYEGVDERVRDHLATRELSIGDYVLTGGELPAMVVIDAVTRLLPGALGAEQGAVTDSFAEGLLEYPQYTRPADFRGWKVPDILLSGNHEQIRRWRRKEALRRTLTRRPDLLQTAQLTDEDRALLAELEVERSSAS